MSVRLDRIADQFDADDVDAEEDDFEPCVECPRVDDCWMLHACQGFEADE